MGVFWRRKKTAFTSCDILAEATDLKSSPMRPTIRRADPDVLSAVGQHYLFMHVQQIELKTHDNFHENRFS